MIPVDCIPMCALFPFQSGDDTGPLAPNFGVLFFLCGVAGENNNCFCSADIPHSTLNNEILINVINGNIIYVGNVLHSDAILI